MHQEIGLGLQLDRRLDEVTMPQSRIEPARASFRSPGAGMGEQAASILAQGAGRWIAGEPGAAEGSVHRDLSAPYTWTQDLRCDIHVHALMACGGLDVDGSWCTPKRSPTILLPVHALSRVFRVKSIDALRRAQPGR
jgi:Putative transposase